jgi:hypothetical protein
MHRDRLFAAQAVRPAMITASGCRLVARGLPLHRPTKVKPRQPTELAGPFLVAGAGFTQGRTSTELKKFV